MTHRLTLTPTLTPSPNPNQVVGTSKYLRARQVKLELQLEGRAGGVPYTVGSSSFDARLHYLLLYYLLLHYLLLHYTTLPSTLLPSTLPPATLLPSTTLLATHYLLLTAYCLLLTSTYALRTAH